MTNTQLTNDLEVLEKLAGEATAGPWEVGRNLKCDCPIDGSCPHVFEREAFIFPPLGESGPVAIAAQRESDNAAFIAAARNFLTPSNIATLKALLAGGQWHGIESAPKDGTEFLGYWDNGDTHVVCIRDGECQRPMDSSLWMMPKFWTPLPAPPSTESP